MSPWRQEADDALADGSTEGALFARRARALPHAELPTLDAILAEVDAPRVARARRVERGRRSAAALAAAACVAALLTRAPGFEERGRIVAEPDDAGAPLRPSGAVRSTPEPVSVEREESAPEATCDVSHDETSGRSPCSRGASRLVSLEPTVAEPPARMSSDDTPRTCSEPATGAEALSAAPECDRAMSCSAMRP